LITLLVGVTSSSRFFNVSFWPKAAIENRLIWVTLMTAIDESGRSNYSPGKTSRRVSAIRPIADIRVIGY
jgi:hypothetical protein